MDAYNCQEEKKDKPESIVGSSINIKDILMQPCLELCEECKKCEFNKNPQNKHKPCHYQYCRGNELHKSGGNNHD